jgi:hypothetical protein
MYLLCIQSTGGLGTGCSGIHRRDVERPSLQLLPRPLVGRGCCHACAGSQPLTLVRCRAARCRAPANEGNEQCDSGPSSDGHHKQDHSRPEEVPGEPARTGPKHPSRSSGRWPAPVRCLGRPQKRGRARRGARRRPPGRSRRDCPFSWGCPRNAHARGSAPPGGVQTWSSVTQCAET